MTDRRRLLTALGLMAPLLFSGCESPECSSNDFSIAECRVVAEWEMAHLQLRNGEELRFLNPAGDELDSREARGRLRETAPNAARARVAGGGAFALSVIPELPGNTLELELENVSPYARVYAGPPGAETLQADDGDGDLTRNLQLDLSSGEPVSVRGELDCPETYRIAFLGDIQTNPFQFERIVESLNESARTAAPEDPPLMALGIVGDLTEGSTDDQFALITDILDRSVIPVITAPGNHDIYRWDIASYNLEFGPGNHASELCTTRLVMLDTGNAELARSVQGRLPELLAHPDHEHLILGMHHPPYPKLTGAGWTREDQAQALLVEAAIAQADLIVAGHYHALRQFFAPVGDLMLKQIITGTGGAGQGLGVPRYGYLRVELGPERVETCFVEIPPLGAEGILHDPADSPVPYCED